MIPKKIRPIYRPQNQGSFFQGQTIATPYAGLFKTLRKAMQTREINDDNFDTIEVWKSVLTKAAIDQITDCKNLFKPYSVDKKTITPHLNAFEIYRHILIATGLDIEEEDINTELEYINLIKTPIFIVMKDSCGDDGVKLNPVYAQVFERLIRSRVEQEFINNLKLILERKKDIFYPEATPFYQWRPLVDFIVDDLKKAAKTADNKMVLGLLSKDPGSDSFHEMDRIEEPKRSLSM